MTAGLPFNFIPVCSILKLKNGRRKQSSGLKWIQERDFNEHYF